jgi:hypothetical protein
MPPGLPQEREEDGMFTTRLRVLLMGAVLATACGGSPTAPERAPSVVLGPGQTVTAPGTELRVSLLDTYVLGAAGILCIAEAPCNFSPHVILRVEAPGVAPENRGAYIPNPLGGEAFTYGGYVVRVQGLIPAWDERAPLDGSDYKVLLKVTPD